MALARRFQLRAVVLERVLAQALAVTVHHTGGVEPGMERVVPLPDLRLHVEQRMHDPGSLRLEREGDHR